VNFLLISALTISIFYFLSKVQFKNDNIVEQKPELMKANSYKYSSMQVHT